MDLRENGLVDPKRHWYYQAKAMVVLAELGEKSRAEERTLLDVGAGSGFFARYLIDAGAVTSAVCVDPGYTELDLERSDAQVQFVHEVPDRTFDAVVMIDVLEHVENDVQLFRDGIARLRPGGIFVVTVPAFQSLWSAHDEHLLHFRRYRCADLRRVIQQTHVQIQTLRYLFGALFPIAFYRRRLRRRSAGTASELGETWGWLNRLLIRWFALEHRFLPQRWLGLSVLAAGVRSS